MLTTLPYGAKLDVQGTSKQPLQRGLDTIVDDLHKAGLEPSTEKSELLLMNRTQYQEKTNMLLQLTLLGKQVPKVTLCQILGFTINQNNNADSNVIQYQQDCRNLTHLMRRIVSKKHWLGERQATQVVTMLVYSRLLYTAPFLTLTQTQTRKLESSLNTLHKAALCLPRYTSNQRLQHTSLFHTLAKLTQQHRDRQVAHLSGTEQGSPPSS